MPSPTAEPIAERINTFLEPKLSRGVDLFTGAVMPVLYPSLTRGRGVHHARTIGRKVERMSETMRTAIWAAAGGVLGGVGGGIVGAIAQLPGAGPIGIGLVLGALVGFLAGLRHS